MRKRILSVVWAVSIAAGMLMLPGILPAAATVTGGTVTAVTDKAQVTALGTSLVQGKTIYAYDFWDGTRQPENAPTMKSANIMGQSNGVWESASAHTVLTDGDFYLKDELAFVTAAGSAEDAYYNDTVDACMVANPYQVEKNKTPLYTKTTAYQRFARYWADGDSYRMYFDLGKVSNITDFLVASGVTPANLEVSAAVTLTADQLKTKAATYDGATFLKQVQIFVSTDLNALYDAGNLVFSYSGTEAESWANLYHLDEAVKGQYVGYKLGASASSHRAVAELGVYGELVREMDNGTTLTTVERVTDRNQVAALGDSLIQDLTWFSYDFWDGTRQPENAPAMTTANMQGQSSGIWECAPTGLHTVVTDGDYYLPGELAFATVPGQAGGLYYNADLGACFVANPYQVERNKTPLYAKTTAYQRFAKYWATSDSQRMYYDLGEENLISEIFVASGVNLTNQEVGTLQSVGAASVVTAQSQYDKNTFARQIKVFIGNDPDTLYDADNMAFSFSEDAEVETWAWANIYHLKEAQRGRFVGFQLGENAGCNYRYIAEMGVYGSKETVQTLGTQLRQEDAVLRTADMRFGFTFPCTGVSRDETTYERILTADSTVTIGNKVYPLVDMGAVVARGDVHPNEELTVELAESGTIRNVLARKLYDVTEETVTFTVVLTGVPRRYFDRAIRIRPYVIYWDGGENVCYYGKEISRCVNHVVEGSEEASMEVAKADIVNGLEVMQAAVDTAAEQAGDYVPLTNYAHLVIDGIWTTALQTALNENEYVYIPDNGVTYWIDTTVTVPSNRHILADDTAIISLTADCEVLMLRNEHTVDGTLYQPDQSNRDENIFIQGGIWKESRDKRLGYGKTGRYDNNRKKGHYYGISTCMLFNNIENLRLKDMTFAKTAGFSVQVGELTNGVFENIFFDSCYADGIHINGNTENVVVRHLRGNVGDDMVALNMYDWQDSSVNFGPTRNVLVEDLVVPTNAAVKEMRILPGVYYFQNGTSVDCAAENILVRNLRGIQYFKMYLQTPVYAIGSKPEAGAVGSGKNIFFEDIQVNVSQPNHWYSSSMAGDSLRNPFGIFELNSNLENVHFKNVDIICNKTQYPMAHILRVGPLSCRKDNTEILDPYISSNVEKITWENITYNLQPIDDLSAHTYIANFTNINGDGMSTGKGEIGSIIKLYQ